MQWKRIAQGMALLVRDGLFPLAARKALDRFRPKAVAAGAADGFRDNPAPAGGASLGAPGPELAREAQSVASGCNECGACVAQCPFLAASGTPAAIARGVLAHEGRTDPFGCSLCNLCGAVCPEKLSPADLLLAMRRQAVAVGAVDLARYATLTRYEARGHSGLFAWYPPAGARTVFFPGCTLPGTRPDVTWRLYERLRQAIPDLGMVLDCCHKPSHDLGRQEFFLERFAAIRDRLAEMGVAEVLVACPNCFKVFDRYGAPLRTATVYEVLARDARPGAASPAGRVVVHDPCPLRFRTAVQDAVRTLLAAQGLEVRKMKHSGKLTLCCGEGGGVGFHNPGFARAWAVQRKESAGDDRIVTYCAGCAGCLGRVAPVSHLGEILFAPKKALAGRCKPARAPLTYVHRLLLKRRLGKLFPSR